VLDMLYVTQSCATIEIHKNKYTNLYL